jgi:hypothetical protein
MTPTVQPARTVESGRNGRSPNGAWNFQTPLPEDQFIAAVSRERQRSERSKKPFALMLAEIRELDSAKFRDALVSKAIHVLRHSIRATDVVGWYRRDQALGVIFAELGNAGKDVALGTLKSRMSDLLQDNLEGVGSAAIKLSFHWFPEDPVPPGGSLDLSVSLEYIMRSKDGKLEDGVKRRDESPSSKNWIPRATRHEMRLPLRYRLEGRQEWSPGEAINISQSGLLFSSDEMLDVAAKLEIIFQASGVTLLRSSTRRALVVRRVLSNWPDTRVLFGVRFGD